MVRESHRASEQTMQKFNVERFGQKELNVVKALEERQFDISNRSAALER